MLFIYNMQGIHSMFRLAHSRLSPHLPVARRAFMTVSLGVLLAGCFDNAKAPSAPAGPPTVEVLTLAAQPVELTRELAGRTRALRIAEIRPQVSGLLQARTFEEGQDVRAGQILYEIDSATYQANVESAQAQLAKADAALSAAKRHYVRQQQLRKIQAVSDQALDSARADYQQAKAQKDIASAAVTLAEINLENSKIKAPIDGRVGVSTITEGSLLTANQAQALTTIQQLNPIHVDLTQSSRELLALRTALREGSLRSDEHGPVQVTLTLEDGTQYPLAGEVKFSDALVDPGTGMVTLRAVFPNPDGVLLPGMYVRASLSAGIKDEAILVPQQAVTHSPTGQPTVFVVKEGGEVELRPFESAGVIGTTWLAERGLTAGEAIVVKGLQKVKPGVVVKAVPWEDSSRESSKGSSKVSAEPSAADNENKSES